LTIKYAYLAQGLSPNEALCRLVFDAAPDGYLKYLDQLFNDLVKSDCTGINEKVGEVADLLRFEGLIGELEFARYFLNKKWRVNLLPSNFFEGRKSPDMSVTSDKREYFVEVKNIQLDDEEHAFGTEVAKFLNSQGKAFVVVVKSSSALCKPAYKYQDLDKKEAASSAALEEFKTKFTQCPATHEKMTINTSAADIELYPTKKGESYLGITTMQEAIGEPQEYSERIKYDIHQKSLKRDGWVGNEREKPYIVAIKDDYSMFFSDGDRYNQDLFGTATYFCSPLPVPEPTLTNTIEHSLSLGWKQYLIEKCLLRNGRSVIVDNQRGLFYNDPKLRNVTAVIAKHQTMYYLFANPFAEDQINSPDVIEAFSDCLHK
jgi:hypothetical protein